MNNGFSLDRRPKNLEQHETLLLSLAFASVVKLLNSKAIFKDLLWNVSNFISTTVNNFVWWNQNNIWNISFPFNFCEFLLSYKLRVIATKITFAKNQYEWFFVSKVISLHVRTHIGLVGNLYIKNQIDKIAALNVFHLFLQSKSDAMFLSKNWLKLPGQEF